MFSEICVADYIITTHTLDTLWVKTARARVFQLACRSWSFARLSSFIVMRQGGTLFNKR